MAPLEVIFVDGLWTWNSGMESAQSTIMSTWKHDTSLDLSELNHWALGVVPVDIRLMIFKVISRMYILSISCEIALRWKAQKTFKDN